MPAIDQTEIDNVIRHLSYDEMGLPTLSGNFGTVAVGNLGMRFFGSYGLLIGRINQMAPGGACRLTGKCLGAVGFGGLEPQPGDVVTMTVTGPVLTAPVTSTVVVPSSLINKSSWTRATVASALAQGFMLSPIFQAAGYFAQADWGSGVYTQMKIPMPVCSIVAPAGVQAFQITTSFEGTTAPQIIQQGQKLSPFLTIQQGNLLSTIFGYLPICDFLESAWLGGTRNFSFIKADDVTMRMDELEVRDEQYIQWIRRMANHCGVPVNRQAQYPVGGGNGLLSY